MGSGYIFPILNSDGTPSSTTVDMQDMFASKNIWTENGLFAWGFNENGQLGINVSAVSGNRSSPVQVGTLSNWKTVSGSSAIKTDGTLWVWGFNENGALGLNDTVHRSSPVQLGTSKDWIQVTTTYRGGSAAINTAGELWVWGVNNVGQLGLGDLVSKSSPVQLGTATDWKYIAMSTENTISTAAIKTDGTLWTWGSGAAGQLGLGSLVHRSSPVQVGTDTDWKMVSLTRSARAAALKTDGTLYSWGNNITGQLGLNDRTNRSSPTQVGSNNNWKQVNMGDASFAIRTDGTLWAWGYNTPGILGLSDFINRSSPTQVGTLTNWKQVSQTQAYPAAAALKTDGTVWSWGSGDFGGLGLNDLNHRSSPVQVGSNTNWKQIGSGAYNVFAIFDDNNILY